MSQMSREQREDLAREVADRLTQRLLREWPESVTHINQLEDLAEALGRQVQQEIAATLIREEAARREGNQTACPGKAGQACPGTAFYRGQNELELVTGAGRLQVQRAYYYCASCRTGHCPADARLGLGPAHTTPTAQARLAVLSALAPYVQVNTLTAQLGLPLHLDIRSTERVAQAVGTRLAAQPREPYAAASRAVTLALDGVMLPTWEGYKETWCAVIYEPDFEVGRTPAAEASLRKEYLATTGSRESLVAAARARAVARCGPGGSLAVLGDAEVLDSMDLRPHLEGKVAAWVEILDFYHVAERLGVIALAMHPQDRTAAESWKGAMKKELLEWGPFKLLQALREWQPVGEGAQEVRREQQGYFEGQQERMRYPQYLRLGFPIGSGSVEGACKHLVGNRFRRTRMRWKSKTAEPMLQLRAALLTHPDLDLRPYAKAA